MSRDLLVLSGKAAVGIADHEMRSLILCSRWVGKFHGICKVGPWERMWNILGSLYDSRGWLASIKSRSGLQLKLHH